MNIRIMTMDDYDKVFELWLSCKGMGLNHVDDSREGIERYLKRNPNTCFVAEERSVILGVILSGHDGRRGYIYHTAVNPDFRKQGIGRKLVEAAMQSMEDEHISKVALVAFEKNQEGNIFWEKQGFSVREDLVYRNCALRELKRVDT